MKTRRALRIVPLTDALLNAVVQIHRSGLGYTLNSRLGSGHMAFLYKSMERDETCYVGVALVDDQPVGVVSGCIDAGGFTTNVLRNMSKAGLAGIGCKMLLHPKLLWSWWQGIVIAAPVEVDSCEVRAVLTAIAVDGQIQGKGIGRALVQAFEDFLRRNGVAAYRLDTRIQNEQASRFYRSLGFHEATRRADSIIFVRQLS